MDGLLNLLPLYTEEKSKEKELSLGQFIETCRIHQSFTETDSASEQSVHSHALGVINAKLNNAESRVEGALMLDVLMGQCRTETFTSNCFSWVQQVMRLLQGSSKAEGGVTACLVLGKLLAFSSQFPEACRQISTTTISQLVPLLCDEDSNHQMAEHTLVCLESCMKHYSGSCGPMKGNIERHLIAMIDSEDLRVGSNLLSLWSSCVALLPALGGSGIQGMQLKTNWIELCCQLVYAIHGCIDNLFTNITEIKTCEMVQPSRALKLPPLHSQNPMVLLHSQRRRFTNLCSALASLLKDPFPASKNIPVDQLLEIIARLLALNSKTLSKAARANFEQITLASIMPDLHSDCIDLLTALIGTCKGQLLTRAGQVMNLFVQVLQWTFTPFDQRRAAVERPYEKLRSKVYRGLVFWLVASRSACGLTKYQDVLVSQLLADIVVQRDTIQLLTVNVVNNGGNRLSKKSKKKMLTDDAPGVIQQKVDVDANAQVCQTALHCLSTLLLYCGARMKPAAHKEMQEVVLSILIDVMNGTPFKSLLPYNTAACRAGLYRVLEKLILCPSAQWPSPLNYATAIFNSGLNDPNLEVSMLCAEALVSIQSVLRPRGPTLSLALDPKQMRYVQQEASLLESLMNKTATVDNGNSMDESTRPLTVQPTPLVTSVQIRMPEMSPLPTVTTTAAVTPLVNQPSVRMDETPLNHITVVSISSASSAEKCDAREISPVQPQPLVKEVNNDQQEPDQNSTRKRRHIDSELAQSKVMRELPYGTDHVDDDLDAMLASFRDTPAF